MMRKAAAFASVTLLTALARFQAALAAGLPAAQYAWGGRFNGTLPLAYRWASVAALPMLIGREPRCQSGIAPRFMGPYPG